MFLEKDCIKTCRKRQHSVRIHNIIYPYILIQNFLEQEHTTSDHGTNNEYFSTKHYIHRVMLVCDHEKAKKPRELSNSLQASQWKLFSLQRPRSFAPHTLTSVKQSELSNLVIFAFDSNPTSAVII